MRRSNTNSTQHGPVGSPLFLQNFFNQTGIDMLLNTIQVNEDQYLPLNYDSSSMRYGLPSFFDYGASSGLGHLMGGNISDVGYLSSPFAGLERAMARSAQETPRVRRILSSEGKEKLRKIKFSKSLAHGCTCPITTNQFKEGDLVTCLPCGHYFDPKSIRKWLCETSATNQFKEGDLIGSNRTRASMCQ